MYNIYIYTHTDTHTQTHTHTHTHTHRHVSISPRMVLKLGHTREMVELLVYNEQGYLITDHNLIETAADEARGVHLSSHPAKLTLQLQIKASPPPMGLGACVFLFFFS